MEYVTQMVYRTYNALIADPAYTALLSFPSLLPALNAPTDSSPDAVLLWSSHGGI